jgi:predicted RNA-binding protein YlxR (DUF448 family)
MRTRTRHKLSLLLLLALAANGCVLFHAKQNAGFAAYIKANKAYADEAVPYQLANRTLIAAKATLTPEQLADYNATRAAVRTANVDVHADLVAWELDGQEPPGFKVHQAALRAAQERMKLLAAEVAGGGQ